MGANAWNYPASQGWTKGQLCNSDVYPTLEHEERPIGVHTVILRRFGRAVAPLVSESNTDQVIRKFNVGDNHCTELVVDMSKNNSQCLTYEWWADNEWHYNGWSDGSCPTDYGSLDRTEHPIGVSCIDILTYGKGGVRPLVELSEDLMIIHNIPTGAAHCIEMFWEGGKNNEYWKEHGYQYPAPLWEPDRCNHTTYNWFNRNETVAEGVVESTWG